jgi:repressor LexA
MSCLRLKQDNFGTATMKSTIGDRIRKARENKEIDQSALASKVDIATRTVQRWEKGEQVPGGDFLMQIARVTGVRPDWLLTGEGDMYIRLDRAPNILRFKQDSTFPKVNLVEIPLLSSVPAGRTAAIFHPEHVERYVTVDNLNDSGAFALTVKGSSMSPKIEDGDIVVVSPQREARSGDICVVRVNEEDVLKMVKFDSEHIHLIPLNTEFDPLTVRKRDITFIWKVVRVIKNL